jgi:hypothetical protein
MLLVRDHGWSLQHNVGMLVSDSFWVRASQPAPSTQLFGNRLSQISDWFYKRAAQQSVVSSSLDCHHTPGAPPLRRPAAAGGRARWRPPPCSLAA